MCMEDVRIGRKEAISEQRIANSATEIPLVQNDPKRTSLLIYPPNLGTNYYSTQPGVTALNGIALVAGNHPLQFNIKEHGQLVTKAWYTIGTDTTVSIVVIEGRLDDT